MTVENIDKNALKWRCRRGTKELDLLFERYLEEYFDKNICDQAGFCALLDYSDPLVLDLLFGRIVDNDPSINNVIKCFQNYFDKSKY